MTVSTEDAHTLPTVQPAGVRAADPCSVIAAAGARLMDMGRERAAVIYRNPFDTVCSRYNTE
jgi:hypothetical protein